MINVKFCIKEKKSEYPCLKMSAKGQIVLFISMNTGTMLDIGDSSCTIGEYSAYWIESLFEPVKYPITIENV